MGDALTARPPDIILYIYNDCACQREIEDMEFFIQTFAYSKGV